MGFSRRPASSGCLKGTSYAATRQRMCAVRRGWVLGMLAGLLFMEARPNTPHLVDEDGKPFRLRLVPVRLETPASVALRSPLLSDGWSALDDRPLVPIPAWSLPEVVFGRTEADGIFLLEDDLRSQGAPSGIAPCGLRTAIGGRSCSY
jgi:hypothetical protein